MDNYDWRVLPQLKDKYVNSVFECLEMGFPIEDASDHFITDIERFWFLKIDEEIAVEMLANYQTGDLNQLILVSLTLGNEIKFHKGYEGLIG